MAFLINPNFTHVVIVVSVMLLLMTNIHPKSRMLKAGMVICLVAAGAEFVCLRVNPWASLLVALSPFPFFIAVRQSRAQNPLFLMSIFMLTISSVFLFVDENNRPVLLHSFAGFVATMCGLFLWITTEALRNVEGARLRDDPNSVVGLIGETRREIESHSAGSVQVDGELWQALSKKPIPAGSTVRILRQDGFWLTVKKVEKLTKE